MDVALGADKLPNSPFKVNVDIDPALSAALSHAGVTMDDISKKAPASKEALVTPLPSGGGIGYGYLDSGSSATPPQISSQYTPLSSQLPFMAPSPLPTSVNAFSPQSSLSPPHSSQPQYAQMSSAYPSAPQQAIYSFASNERQRESQSLYDAELMREYVVPHDQAQMYYQQNPNQRRDFGNESLGIGRGSGATGSIGQYPQQMYPTSGFQNLSSIAPYPPTSQQPMSGMPSDAFSGFLDYTDGPVMFSDADFK